MERRQFMGTLGSALGLTVLVSFVYPLFRFLSPRKHKALPTRVVISKADIPTGAAQEVAVNNTPVIVINRRGKGFVAFSRVCTHFGCLVRYDRAQGRLICPCHAGEFSLDGKVIAGPPPRPLDRIPLKVEGEKVYIG